MATPRLYAEHQVKSVQANGDRMVEVYLGTVDPIRLRKEPETPLETLSFAIPIEHAEVLGKQLLSAANLIRRLNETDLKRN